MRKIKEKFKIRFYLNLIKKKNGFTFNNLVASKFASSICGRHGVKSQFNLDGDGGVNSGIPFVFPSSSYLFP